MKIRCCSPVARFTAAVCLLAAFSACSLLHRHRADASASKPAPAGKASYTANARGLALELKFSPDPVKLGEVREINVNLIVHNVSKQPATLKFKSTQILEIQLRDADTGAVVSKWSTDRTFSDDSRIVTVNGGERLEYTEPLTTRELKPGKTYNLEANYVGYEKTLVAKKVLIPQP